MSNQPPQWGDSENTGGPDLNKPQDGGVGGPPPGDQVPPSYSGGNAFSGQNQPANNTQSTVALILGIIVALCCCGIGFPFTLPSLVLGILGAVFSAQAISSRNAGDSVEAAKKQKLAWILIGVGAAIGLIAFSIAFALGAAELFSNFDEIVKQSTPTTADF